jgi:UDP-glucose 4-epimerase
MQTTLVHSLVFSSSATVYGHPEYLPYDEVHPTNPINPYGDTKLQVEIMLRNLANSDSNWKIACLRYFNPVGAHDSGLIGDDPSGIPANLIPYLARVASGDLECLSVFGNDYETHDGTGERDYIHVMDLAEGHVAALPFLEAHAGFHIINLGTGKSTSVLKCIEEFERASGKQIPIKIVSRRNGDLPIYFAKVDLAKQTLGWSADRTVADMCSSAWKFQSMQINRT